MRICRPLFGIGLALFFAGNVWPQGVITKFAGGPFIFTGNGQPALNAPIGVITGVTLDPSGRLVIADGGNSLVERVNSDGTLTVIAGNGFTLGIHSGDGGLAVNAELNEVYGVAYDLVGNLYIAEVDRISQVTPQGIINTYAGGGSDALSNGIPALNAEVSTYGIGGGLAVDAAGAVYFSEYFNNRVRKIAANGTISTVAGTGPPGYSGDGGPAAAAALNGPLGLAVDRAGNLYIADNSNLAVREVTPGGVISTFLQKINAVGLAFDNNANFYVAGDGLIYKLTSGTASPVLIGGTPANPIGFSGDGNPALSAQFSALPSIVADNAGNLYIGDDQNDRVREIAASGTVTTVAGNGQFYYTGEGVPSATSPVRGGGGLAIDKSGNIYYSDPIGSRVRKVSGGVINTVAGTGIAGFGGDGGPGTEAQLDFPEDIAVDSGGNVYIADKFNSRIRKVASNGTISTYAHLPGNVVGVAVDAAGNVYASDGIATVYRVDTAGQQTVFAGTGTAGYSGDGGSAAQAMLSAPTGLAVDSSGNIYIADAGNGLIRIVNTSGMIRSAVFANYPYTLPNPRELAFDAAGNLYISDETADVILMFSEGYLFLFAGDGYAEPGDGLLATQAIIVPYGIVADSSGNVYIDDDDGIQEVLATPPTMSVQQNSLTLSSFSGSAPVNQTVGVIGSIPGLAFATNVTTQTGGNWLSVSAANGNTPELLTITADPSNLAEGSYNGAITIYPYNALPSSIPINVTMVVRAAQPPQLSVDQPSLSFTYPSGAPARAITLKVSNSGGGGALQFIVAPSTNTGGSWLSAQPVLATAYPGTPVPVNVYANPANLPVGTYTGSITITSQGGGKVVVPVSMMVSNLGQALLLSQSGLSFTGVAQGGVVPPQSFGVVNLGTGSLPWTASVSALTGGTWLSTTPAGGTSIAGQPAPQVTVTVNPNGLAAGDYYGQVRIDAPGAANTPEVVTVFFEVLQAGSDPGGQVVPTELFFAATANGGSPGAQPVQLYNVSGSPETFYVDVPSAQFELAELPGDGTVYPNQPATMLLQPLGSFPAGTYTDVMNVQFSDGRIQAVKIHVIAAAGNSSAVSPAKRDNARPRDTQPSCTPMELIPALTTLSQAFSVHAGWPVALAVQSLDNCNNPQTTGSVTVDFSNGDPPLSLTSLNDGTWQGTWATTQTSVAQTVTLTITATNPQQLTGTTQVNGGVGSPMTPPVFTSSGIVSAAGGVPYTALAPGSSITIYGSQLADYEAPATTYPLPTSLGNATVIIGDTPLPLSYVAPGQINAVVPSGINTNTTYQMFIARDETYSNPANVNIADAQPALYTSGGSAIAQDYRGTAPLFYVTASAPAQAGDVLVFYCAGLGATNPAVPDGTPGPASPAAQTQGQVTASIGSQAANVIYSGLVAGMVGLYQVNVTMPAGVTPDSATPVTITVDGQTSPSAAIATQ